jgi:PQQ-dependent catabolism-associated CXXCW motif protein
MKAAFAAVLGAVVLLAASPAPANPPPEPEGYRTENFRAPTPATLRGAQVVDVFDAATLWEEGSAAFIDVMPRPPRPANLPAGTVWRDPPRSSIPGAIWLANVGFGALSPAAEAYFERGLKEAGKGDPDRPIVFFCERACWMSWNAAKRALALGHRQVLWFPDGTDGWTEAGLPLERVEPLP